MTSLEKIKNPKKLITDQIEINNFENKIENIKTQKDTSLAVDLKRNYFLRKKLSLKIKDQKTRIFIARKFLLENLYENVFLLEDDWEDFVDYFISKQNQLLKVEYKNKKIIITTINENRIFATSLKIKNNRSKFKINFHLLNDKPLGRESLNETIASYKIKSDVKKRFKKIIDKWKNVKEITSKKSLEEIAKMDFNNLRKKSQN